MYSYNKLIDLIYYPIRFKNLLNLKKKIIFTIFQGQEVHLLNLF